MADQKKYDIPEVTVILASALDTVTEIIMKKMNDFIKMKANKGEILSNTELVRMIDIFKIEVIANLVEQVKLAANQIDEEKKDA